MHIRWFGRKPITAFISYRRRSSAALSQYIYEALQRFGIEAFVDSRREDSGGPFPDRLLRAIKSSDVFICLIGEGTFESEWVVREISHAYTLGKVQIPVFQQSYVPLTNPPSRAIEQLLQSQGKRFYDIDNVMMDKSVEELASLIHNSVPSRTPSSSAILSGILTILIVAILILFLSLSYRANTAAFNETAVALTGISALATSANNSTNTAQVENSFATSTALHATVKAADSIILTNRAITLTLTPIYTKTVFSSPTADKNSIPAGTERIFQDGSRMVFTPSGCFMMGTDPAIFPYIGNEEQPVHKVCITHDYYIDQMEVTNASFQRFVEAGGYSTRKYWSAAGWKWKNDQKRTGPEDFPDFSAPEQPRIGITWYEAEAYANWRGGRLPTEAEWEYAARGVEVPIYPWGDKYDPKRLNAEDRLHMTAPVGSYPLGASWVMARDMSGNVWEWVNDWIDIDYYRKSVQNDPLGPVDGEYKVIRGGSWYDDAGSVRAAARYWELPMGSSQLIGFRIVVDIQF